MNKRPFFWCLKNLEQSMGDNVNAIDVEINTVPIIIATNSLNNNPVVPPKESIGTKTAIKTTDVASTAKKISLVPATAACLGAILFSIL